ncbi:MAG TPA: PRC-barrel domain-containing protein [Opitutaceae bacterium]|nr:PRC-barrel domain-containing protein [Opitutaceae bacterium]
MFQDIKQLYGRKLGATDGDIGHVKDFYFDDQTWAVRYLVADTGSWLAGRQVLLPPHAFGPQAFGRSDADSNVLLVNLTRKQIEDSPSIDSHRPVSRQYEQAYYLHFGWPAYWQDGGMSGIAGFPPVALPPIPANPPHHGHQQRDDIHLRSTKAVTGYHLQATDGPIGTVRSFMVHGKSWAIRELVVETGHWYAGKTVLLLPENISRISYDESTVFVNLTREDIAQTTSNDVAQAATDRH